jgi:hypothetical protein
VQDGIETEWQSFREERTQGIEEINQLRQRVAEEESRKKLDNKENGVEQDSSVPQEPAVSTSASSNPKQDINDDAHMQVDEPVKNSAQEGNKDDSTATIETANSEPDRKEEQSAPPQADEDDAVEY